MYFSRLIEQIYRAMQHMGIGRPGRKHIPTRLRMLLQVTKTCVFKKTYTSLESKKGERSKEG